MSPATDSALSADLPAEKAQNAQHYDLICLSHLRWDFVTQRPQHLLSRCARNHRVFFVEEPVFEAGIEPYLDVTPRPEGVQVAVPHLPEGLPFEDAEAAQAKLLDDLLAEKDITRCVVWFYTPMALGFAQNLKPVAVVFDAMDELSAFAGAPPLLLQRESDLFGKADVVFTGGQSLYDSKRTRHHNVHAFPSSVDTAHFATARKGPEDPSDQAGIPHPRLGFYGVIDERLDIPLLEQVADMKPDWHWIILGPVVKIDPASLPQRPNIHYLGGKSYAELPTYIAGWDVALLLFARNESTKFISPTKTPEYMAAGKPVVSTSIKDVVRPYGDQGLARIADAPTDFVAACEAALSEDREAAQARADTFLATMSWDKTWGHMAALIDEAIEKRMASPPPPPSAS